MLCVSPQGAVADGRRACLVRLFSPGKLALADFGVEPPAWDVYLNDIAVLQQADLAACRRFGADVPDARPCGSAAARLGRSIRFAPYFEHTPENVNKLLSHYVR